MVVFIIIKMVDDGGSSQPRSLAAQRIPPPCVIMRFNGKKIMVATSVYGCKFCVRFLKSRYNEGHKDVKMFKDINFPFLKKLIF